MDESDKKDFLDAIESFKVGIVPNRPSLKRFEAVLKMTREEDRPEKVLKAINDIKKKVKGLTNDDMILITSFYSAFCECVKPFGSGTQKEIMNEIKDQITDALKDKLNARRFVEEKLLRRLRKK